MSAQATYEDRKAAAKKEAARASLGPKVFQGLRITPALSSSVRQKQKYLRYKKDSNPTQKQAIQDKIFKAHGFKNDEHAEFARNEIAEMLRQDYIADASKKTRQTYYNAKIDSIKKQIMERRSTTPTVPTRSGGRKRKAEAEGKGKAKRMRSPETERLRGGGPEPPEPSDRPEKESSSSTVRPRSKKQAREEQLMDLTLTPSPGPERARTAAPRGGRRRSLSRVPPHTPRTARARSQSPKRRPIPSSQADASTVRKPVKSPVEDKPSMQAMQPRKRRTVPLPPQGRRQGWQAPPRLVRAVQAARAVRLLQSYRQQWL